MAQNAKSLKQMQKEVAEMKETLVLERQIAELKKEIAALKQDAEPTRTGLPVQRLVDYGFLAGIGIFAAGVVSVVIGHFTIGIGFAALSAILIGVKLGLRDRGHHQAQAQPAR